MTPEQFDEYYRSETNRRLLAIEEDLKLLMEVRSQLLALSAACSSLISLLIALVIPFITKK